MEQTGISIIGGVIFLFSLVISLVFFVFWLWTLIDCIRREHKGENTKLIWVLVIVLVGPLGSLIYLLAGRSNTYLPNKT
ncbi:MAG: PLDc N-terminal domain-containing protein [Puniceicoccales bacterium]|jgi:hypothetical protein|nr:PLDc N-terminal domain-containing protein [Puniceicoccales bacterium]